MFYRMDPADKWYLVSVLLFTVVMFLPWSRDITVLGVSLFGWLMAGLMILSPVAALILLVVQARNVKH